MTKHIPLCERALKMREDGISNAAIAGLLGIRHEWVSRTLKRGRERRQRILSDSTLTPRQTQILPYLIKGERYRLIASRLGISKRTVEAHMAAILVRSGSKNVIQAAVWADRRMRATEAVA